METVLIGKIANTHGIKGELKIVPTTDFIEERFFVGSKIKIYNNTNFIEEVIIKHLRMHKGNLLLTLDGKEDINLVEKYKGMQFRYDIEKLHELEDGEFYQRDLLNCKVILNNEILGEVSELIETGSNDVFRVKTNDKDILIPYLDSIIISIDIEKKEIVIKEMDGLI